MKALRARYGGGPGHLLATLACFAIAAAAVVGWTQRPQDLHNVLLWFAGAILLHDLVFLPVYSLIDRFTISRLPQRAIGYVRVPLLIGLLVLAGTFPTVLGYGASSEHHASGIYEHGYLARWLLLCGALLALSALSYAARGRRVR